MLVQASVLDRPEASPKTCATPIRYSSPNNCEHSCALLPTYRGSPLLKSLVTLGGLEYLALIIKGRDQYGLLDNQASYNFMSLSFAEEHGIDIYTTGRAVTLMNGRILNTMGQVRLKCVIRLEREDYLLDCEFEILHSAFQPIVLGRPFLQSLCSRTGQNARPWLLEPTLRDMTTASDHTGLIFQLDWRLKIRFRHRLTDCQAVAVVDQAATANIMSVAFARQLNVSFKNERGSRGFVITGDGCVVQSVGEVRISAFFDSNKTPSRRLLLDFIVLPNLAFDVVLGMPTLRTLQHWAVNGYNLTWTPVLEPRLLLCCSGVGKNVNLAWENQALFQQHQKVQKEAVDVQQILQRKRDEDRDAKQLSQMSALQTKKVKAEQVLEYYRSIGNVKGIQEQVEEVARLEAALRPSPAPSLQGGNQGPRPPHRHGWGLFRR